MRKVLVTKVKRLISLLTYEEIVEIEKHTKVRRDLKWKEKREAETKSHIEQIKALPIGTEVLCTDGRLKTGGLVGRITEIAREYASIDFGDEGIRETKYQHWRVPIRYLSTDTSEEKRKTILMAKAMNKRLTGIFRRPPADRRPRCHACWQRLDRGQSRRFTCYAQNGRKLYSETVHRFKKDCGKSSRWADLKKKCQKPF